MRLKFSFLYRFDFVNIFLNVTKVTSGSLTVFRRMLSVLITLKEESIVLLIFPFLSVRFWSKFWVFLYIFGTHGWVKTFVTNFSCQKIIYINDKQGMCLLKNDQQRKLRVDKIDLFLQHLHDVYIYCNSKNHSENFRGHKERCYFCYNF